jgi:hypothetical protein
MRGVAAECWLSGAHVSEQRARLGSQHLSELQCAEETRSAAVLGSVHPLAVAVFRASFAASSIAARILDASPFPVPAISSAVP